MFSAAVALSLLFASPDTAVFSDAEPAESITIVTKVIGCTDVVNELTMAGHCFIVTANQGQLTLFLIRGVPQSLKMRNGTLTFTIWER